MPFFYRCDVTFTDPNDNLRKSFNVYTSFENNVNQFIVLKQTERRAYELIKTYKVTDASLYQSNADFELSIDSCEGVDE